MTEESFDLTYECVRLFRDAGDDFDKRLKVLALMEKVGFFGKPVDVGPPKSGSDAFSARGILDAMNGKPPA